MKWPLYLCGLCSDDGEDATGDERQPLLSGHEHDADDTALQHRLRQKLQTFQMLQATTRGYLPSTKQVTAHVRTFLEAPSTSHQLSPAGQKLSRLGRLWLTQLADLLQNKNGNDQIQDFAWYISRSSISADLDGIRRRAATANDTAIQRSLQTVGSLLLANSSVRLLLADVAAVGREVFRDTAFALADASQTAAVRLEPASQEAEEEAAAAASTAEDGLQDVRDNVADVAEEVTDGVAAVAAAAQQSVTDRLVNNDGNTRQRLLSRLRQAVQQLLQQPDYATSVSILTRLLERGLAVYARTLEDAAAAVETNDEADAALRNFWAFISTFGDVEAWKELQTRFQRLHERTRGADASRQLEALVHQAAAALQAMLTDPDYFDRADDRLDSLDSLRNMVRELDDGSSSAASGSASASLLQQQLDGLFAQMQVALQSALEDGDVAALTATSGSIASLLCPGGEQDGYASADLLADAASVFLPQIVQAVQYVPIPRLEVATPDVDLLLENLVLQPGRTVNHSSFLPFRLHVQIRSDMDVHKARFGTAARIASTASVAVDGLSLAADDVGFVLRLHAGPLLRCSDEGLVSFHLDERGIDVHLDVDVVRGSAEQLLTLRQTQVRIHHVGFRLHRSRVSWLAWLLRPVLRPLLRRTLERQLARAITDNLRLLNRELVFARERLRAARIANPNDVASLLRAVTSRFAEAEDDGRHDDLDQSVRVGLKPPERGPFAGVYAPGSLALVWDEEAARAGERVHEYRRDGWRNAVFDATIEA